MRLISSAALSLTLLTVFIQSQQVSRAQSSNPNAPVEVKRYVLYIGACGSNGPALPSTAFEDPGAAEKLAAEIRSERDLDGKVIYCDVFVRTESANVYPSSNRVLPRQKSALEQAMRPDEIQRPNNEPAAGSATAKLGSAIPDSNELGLSKLVSAKNAASEAPASTTTTGGRVEITGEGKSTLKLVLQAYEDRQAAQADHILLKSYEKVLKDAQRELEDSIIKLVEDNVAGKDTSTAEAIYVKKRSAYDSAREEFLIENSKVSSKVGELQASQRAIRNEHLLSARPVKTTEVVAKPSPAPPPTPAWARGIPAARKQWYEMKGDELTRELQRLQQEAAQAEMKPPANNNSAMYTVWGKQYVGSAIEVGTYDSLAAARQAMRNNAASRTASQFEVWIVDSSGKQVDQISRGY